MPALYDKVAAKANSIYDLHNPKHFTFSLNYAYGDFDAPDYEGLFVEIHPREDLCDRSFVQYYEEDYVGSDGGVDFTWAPKSILDEDGYVDEISECCFEIFAEPDVVKKELLALGLTCEDDEDEAA